MLGDREVHDKLFFDETMVGPRIKVVDLDVMVGHQDVNDPAEGSPVLARIEKQRPLR